MISPSFFCQLKVHTCKKKKKPSPKVERLTFPPFFYFLICVQVWLRSGQGEVSLLRCALLFFHMGLKSASSQIHIDWFGLFCKLKISHSFDADRNAVLCSPPCFWKQSLGRPAFPFFFFFFFLNTSPRSWKKGQRNPLNPWMDSHQRRMRLRERQRDTGGWGLGWE